MREIFHNDWMALKEMAPFILLGIGIMLCLTIIMIVINRQVSKQEEKEAQELADHQAHLEELEESNNQRYRTIYIFDSEVRSRKV